MLNQTSLLACIVLVVILVTLIIFYSYKRIVNNEEEVARLTDKINALENSQVKLSEFVQGNMLHMQMQQQMVPPHQMMNHQHDNNNEYEHDSNNENYEHPEEGLVEVETEEESEQTPNVLTLDDVIRRARETQECPEEEDVYNVDESEKIENNDEEDLLEADEFEPDENEINENEQENNNEEDPLEEEEYEPDDEDEINEEDEHNETDEEDETDKDYETDEEEVSHHSITKTKRGRKVKKSIKKKQLKQRGPKGRVPSTAPRGLEIGHQMRSDRDGQLYEVTETANGRIRWMVIKENQNDTDNED